MERAAAQRMGRRPLLAAALGAGLAACARGPGQGAPLPFEVSIGRNWLNSRQQLAAFRHFYPGVLPVAPDAPATGNLPMWGVGDCEPFEPTSATVRLQGAMRAANYNAAVLLPGALQAFSDPQGRPYGLPVSVMPGCFLCNVHALQAARLPVPPPPSWTVDDFETACAAIQRAVAAGRATTVYGPLPPMTGTAGAPPDTRTGALRIADLWGAFILGYGGWMVKDGRFDLANAGAVAGISRLLAIAGNYGAPASYLPLGGRLTNDGSSPAFQYYTYLGEGTPGPAWCFARFPRLPVRAVVPATPTGVTLVRIDSPAYTPLFGGRPPNGARQAVVEYVLWRYALSVENPSVPYLPPPALSAPKVQAAYWAAQNNVGNPTGSGADGIGDWADYTFVEDGWPAVTATVFNTVFQELSTAVASAATVSAALAQATARLNALPAPRG